MPMTSEAHHARATKHYEVSYGASYSAAEVSGIVALMLQRKPDLTPDARHPAGDRKGSRTEGPDVMFGAGLADAYGALMAEPAPGKQPAPRPIERVSTGAR